MRRVAFAFALISILLVGCASDQSQANQGARLLSIKDSSPGSSYVVGVYVVASGDTIIKICKQFNMTVHEFEELNPEMFENRHGQMYLWQVGQQVRVFQRTGQDKE